MSLAFSVNTPEGTRDRLFSECLERRQVQRALTDLFQRRGYGEVITPEVEYYDLFIQSGNPLPQEAMLKLIDRRQNYGDEAGLYDPDRPGGGNKAQERTVAPTALL